MYKLTRVSPIKGTYLEHTYEEVVAVTDGVCCVQKESARDALLQRGFILAVEDSSPEEAKVQKGKWKTKGVVSA